MPSASLPVEPRVDKPSWKRKRILIPAGAVLVFAIAIAIGSGGGDGDGTPPPSATSTAPPEAVEAQTADEVSVDEEDDAQREAEEARAAEEEAERLAEEERQAEEARLAEETRAAEEAAEAARAGTVSQQNAYRSATSYLSFTAFSRVGLIDQLSSEYGDGYPREDAEFAVARLEAEGGVDWNEQAAKAAQNYLDLTGFSRSGLIDQLTSEYGDGFTREQAEYGVDQTGL